VGEVIFYVDHARFGSGGKIVRKAAGKQLIHTEVKGKKERENQKQGEDAFGFTHFLPQLLSDKVDDGTVKIGVNRPNKMDEGQNEAKGDQPDQKSGKAIHHWLALTYRKCRRSTEVRCRSRSERRARRRCRKGSFSPSAFLFQIELFRRNRR